MVNVKLNFINHSKDRNNSQVVLFQKNVTASANELIYAWMVIEKCGVGDTHPFIYPTQMQVAISDSYGNYTPLQEAAPGQQFQVSLTQTGDTLSYFGNATAPDEVQVVNNLELGAMNTCIYKNNALLAMKTTIAPGQLAAFQFNPTLWIGVVSQVVEGSGLNSAILATINTELSLLGVTRADIVMTGGGPGPNSKPFHFELKNVVMG